MAQVAAAEAIEDSGIDLRQIDGNRCGCAISGHMGDWRWLRQYHGTAPADRPGDVSNWEQFLPNSGCWNIAQRYGLNGPRICHSTACASGLIDLMCAVRAIADGQCDWPWPVAPRPSIRCLPQVFKRCGSWQRPKTPRWRVAPSTSIGPVS